jgi:hypothetical protein
MAASFARIGVGNSASPGVDDAIPPAIREKGKSQQQLLKLLVFILLNGVVLNAGFVALNVYLVHQNLGMKGHGNFGPLRFFVKGKMGTDSNAVMFSALHVFQRNPTGSVYDVVFFQNHQKFQTPLSSLVPYYLLEAVGASDHQLVLFSTAVCWLSVCGVILLTFVIALRRFQGERSRRNTAMIAVVVGIAGFLFYPLMRGYSLGQTQTFLTLGFTIAFFCWTSGHEKTAGAIMGLMTLVKPQYALFLIWALLRRKIGAFAASLVCAVSGVLLACLVFGVHNNLDYLKVIHVLSVHGESFDANQSVNGLLNRLLFNGNNLLWDADHFPPYNSIVYFGTLVTSFVILVFAFFYPWGDRRKGGAADFACCVLAATMASPIAWQHHYAILLPIFAWLWFGEYSGGVATRAVFPIAIAYVLISDNILPVSAFANIPVLNILQSYLYFGAAMVLVLLSKSNNEQLNRAVA